MRARARHTAAHGLATSGRRHRCGVTLSPPHARNILAIKKLWPLRSPALVHAPTPTHRPHARVLALPVRQALIHGLNRHYYSIALSYRKNELEVQMLMNLHKKSWTSGLKLADYEDHAKENDSVS